MRTYPSAEQRFWPKVERIPFHTCWEWVGVRDAHGYGTFSLNGGQVRAHRFSYELLVGPIPDGLVIDHLCRNHGCVRPEHLEPVTDAENIRRGMQGSLRTECENGHPYDAENTYRRPNGQRDCRTCIRERVRSYGRTHQLRSRYPTWLAAHSVEERRAIWRDWYQRKAERRCAALSDLAVVEDE